MSVTKELFGTTRDGKEVYCYSIENKNGMIAKVMTFGAILKNLYVPNAKGKVEDVVLGYDKLWMYFANGSCFGSTIGPIANRTREGKFSVGGKKYQLPVNDRKVNNLHTDLKNGFHKRVWDAEAGKNSVTFSLKKKDGEMGHPGNMIVSVTYTLTNQNELKITYHAESDKDTVINMTNHSYFNLSGPKSDSIEATRLTIHASEFVPVDKLAIPTGEILPVKGTPMDFTKEKAIGKEIGKKEYDQIKICGGYDHNWVVDGYNGKLKQIACARDTKSGRTMEVYTDLPGVQFYAGNFIGSNTGKEGCRNGKRKGFCLETQYFPNSAAEKNFYQPVFGPGKEYDTTTVYKFLW
ncbi:MAG: galactose mutarotase [Lachnospiraceae bacterium]|nr:galactose mutarotase [Lachnospiraceae bacterium]